jgi:hypothetical protein
LGLHCRHQIRLLQQLQPFDNTGFATWSIKLYPQMLPYRIQE